MQRSRACNPRLLASQPPTPHPHSRTSLSAPPVSTASPSGASTAALSCPLVLPSSTRMAWQSYVSQYVSYEKGWWGSG